MAYTKQFIANSFNTTWPQTPAFSSTLSSKTYRNATGQLGQAKIQTGILPDQSRYQKLTFESATVNWAQTPSFSSTLSSKTYRNGSNLIGQYKRVSMILVIPQANLAPAAAIPSRQAWFAPVVRANPRVTPASPIPTRQAWFAPIVAGPIKLNSAIPTRKAWFAPEVSFLRIIPPAPIPTRKAWFAPVVIRGPFISAPAIASRQDWFAPVVAGPITVSPIPQRRNWFNPVVAGPISLAAAIASRQAWAQPTVTAAQLVSATVIPSRQSWPSPLVAHVQTIRPAGAIPTRQHWFAPLVTGGDQFIAIAAPFALRRLIRPPSISGGVLNSIQVFLGGFDVTKYYRAQTGDVNSQTIGRWNWTCDFFDKAGLFVPALGQTLVVIDYGRKLFAGCLQEFVTDRILGSHQAITFHCTAVDKTGICDHRRVPYKVYKAGTDVVDMILDVVQNWLNGEGITTGGVPARGVLGTLPTDVVINFWTVTQVFDKAAEFSGTIWFVDVNGDLTFNSFNNLPAAPFGLTETSKNWRALTVRQSLVDYRNVQYAVSNLSVLPGAGAGGSGGGSGSGRTETFTWTVGQPGIISRLIPDGMGGFVEVAEFIACSLPIGSIISIKVNGITQTVYELSSFAGQTSTGPNDYVWVYATAIDSSSTTGVQAGPTFGPIPAGATVVVNYIPATVNASAEIGTALDPIPPPGAPTSGTLGTCGSGRYDAVEQVQDISSQADLNAIAQAVLTRRGGVPTFVDFETDRPGLQPGQLLPVNIPLIYVPTRNFLITSVRGHHMSADLGLAKDAVGLWHGSFRWTVSATSNEDPGNWVKWFERLIARTQVALPVYQFEEAPFAIANDGSSIAGLVSTNPYIVKRTGLLFDMHTACAEPPLDQDLTLRFFVNNIAVPGQVVIPAGSAANLDHAYAFPTTAPLYVFARPPLGPNDVVTVSGTYRVTGPNPVAASKITAWLRWRI